MPVCPLGARCTGQHPAPQLPHTGAQTSASAFGCPRERETNVSTRWREHSPALIQSHFPPFHIIHRYVLGIFLANLTVIRPSRTQVRLLVLNGRGEPLNARSLGKTSHAHALSTDVHNLGSINGSSPWGSGGCSQAWPWLADSLGLS